MQNVMGGSARLVVQLVALAALTALWTASAQAGGVAQNQGMAARFPEPGQVLADFDDDPSRYVALNVLYFALQQKTPAPRSAAADAKITVYYRAFSGLENKYLTKGADPQAAKDYRSRTRQLFSDPNFKRSVLEKYHLALRVPHKLIHSNKIDWFIAEQYSSQCNILEALEPT